VIKIKIERDFATGQINLFVADVTREHLAIARPVEFTFDTLQDYNPSQLSPMSHITPTISIRHDADDFFKVLTQELLAAGFGPKPETNTPELNAVKRHLEDMRTLVFDRERPA
jgi:hypothetical protein